MPISLQASYYFYEPFTNYAGVVNRWQPNFPYGQSGVFIPTPAERTTKFVVINNQACFTGAVQSHNEWGNNDWYGTYWTGNTARLTNANGIRKFSASETQPFGYQVYRTWARLDAHQESVYPENTGCANGGMIWLIQDDDTVSGTVEFQSFQNVAGLFERYRSDVNTNAVLGGFRSQWGSFVLAENRFNLLNVNFSGGSVDLVNNIDRGLEWNYEDLWGLGTSGGGGVANTRISNTNILGLKITHDGSVVCFYINPNPFDRAGNPYPNEYILMGQENVSWNDNLRIMMGHESHNYYTEKEDVRYDDLLVRSVADTLTSEIFPAEIKVGSKIDFSYFLKPVFSSKDSGIGEIRIRKPSTYLSAWSNIRVYTEWGDGVNDGNLNQLVSTNGNPQGVSRVWITTNGNEIFIRFCQLSDSIHAVIRSNTQNPQIEVRFSLTAPLLPSVTGDAFTAFVNCKKYFNTQYSTNSTTADMKAVDGNAADICYSDISIVPDTDTAVVKGFTDPAAYASITPNKMYQDTYGFEVNYFIATSPTNSGPAIVEAIINIPQGFTVSNVSSLHIQNATNIKIGLVNGTNRIRLLYINEGKSVPGQAGIDFVRFKLTTTPTNGDYTWTSLVKSDVDGTLVTFTSTNSSYKSQVIQVIPPPPVASAYETTLDNKVYTTLSSNRYNYYIVNTAERPINKIKRAKIELPGIFYDVTNVISQIVPVSSIKVSNNFIIVDYSLTGTNISPFNKYDLISFTAWDMVNPLIVTNVSILAYVDNFNSEGYKPVTEGSIDYDLSFVLPDASATASIKTNSVFAVYTTNTFTYKIYNSGSKSNEIYLGRIIIPSVFDSILPLTSLKASSMTVSNSTIFLDYQPGKLKPGELDSITFKMRTAYLQETNVEIRSEVCNSPDTNYFKTTGVLGGGSQYVSLVYPEPELMAYVEVNSNSSPPLYIDSSTVTNEMVCHIRNDGEAGNDIRSVTIALPKAIFTNAFYTNNGSFYCAKSELLTTFDANVRFYDPPTGDIRYFLINYSGAGSPLTPGSQDEIRFKVVDKIVGNTNFTVSIAASNVKSKIVAGTELFKTQDVIIKIPPADVAGGIQPGLQYTGTGLSNTFVYTVKNKGRGSNRVYKVVITNTSGIAGWSITSAVNTAFTNPAFVSVSPNKVVVDYEGAGRLLGPQSTDSIALTLTGSLSKLTNIVFEMRADNDDGNGLVATSVISNGTKTVNSTVQPVFSVSPREVFTTVPSAAYQLAIQNGSVKGQKLYKLRIPLNVPAYTTNGVSFSSIVWAGATTARSGSDLIIDYSLNPLDAGQSDIIGINLQDTVITPTNILWNLDVDYNDGFGWRSANPSSPGTNQVSFLLPAASASFAVTPNSISKDVNETFFVIQLSNSGVVGNKIQMAKIQVPLFLTNVSTVTSSVMGTSAIFSNQAIYLRYYLSTTNLSPGSVDMIRFTGFDNVEVSAEDSWSVDVANSSMVSAYTAASVRSFGRDVLSVILPAYDAKMYVSPNSVDTVSVTNQYVLQLQNTSSNIGNDILVYDVFLPSVIITNQMRISNLRPSTIQKMSNRIRITYVGGLGVGLSDTIKIYALDNWLEGETNLSWNSEAQFSTSGSFFIPVRTPNVVGQTNNLFFEMPNPEISVSILPVEIYTTSVTNRIRLVLKNNGKPGNSIYNAKIRLPSVLTNSFVSSLASSTNALGISYASGLLDLNYSGLVSGATDAITLTTVNSRTSVATVSFALTVSNILKKSGVAGSTNLAVVVPPSCFVIPNQVETTSFSNMFDYYIRNDGSGNYPVKRAVITLPPSLTNFNYYGSIKASNFMKTKTSITIVYPGAGLAKGDQDTVKLMGFDNMSYGSNSDVWPVCLVDNSYSKASARLNPGQSLRLVFSMPPPNVNFFVSKGTNNLIFVNEDTNSFSITLTNAGSGGNGIYQAVVALPGAFTNYDLISSTKLYSPFNLIKGVSSFTLMYQSDTNGLLKPGEKDVISVRGYDNVTKNTTVFLSCGVDNFDGKGYYPAPKLTGKLNSLKFSFPPNAIAAYIENESSSIYTFNTNMRQNFNGVPLTFKIENLSFTNQIDYVRIPFHFPNYRTNIVVRSSMAPLAGITNKGNEIIIDYTVAGTVISNNKSDTISIDLYYCMSNIAAVTMACKVRFLGFSTNIDTVVPSGRENILSIDKATWGKAAGQVYPASLITTIRLFEMGSSSIALDRLGRPASYSFDSTKPFLLDNIVPGLYKFEYSSDGYLTGFYSVTNIEIKTNNIRYSNNRVLYYVLPDTRLKANALKSRLDGEQVRIFTAKDGSSARFLAPEGSLASDFYLEIDSRPVENDELAAMMNNKELIQPSSFIGMRVFDFDVENLNETDIGLVNLKSEGQIELPLDSAFLASSGWNLAKLAIAYYDPSTSKWIVIGGKVNSLNQTIIANVNYLYRSYTVVAIESTGDVIMNVKVDNNPFTPLSADEAYRTANIVFLLNDSIEEVTVNIFNLKGEIIKSLKVDGTYGQCAVPWDGKDKDLKPVPAGVYIYQIRAGKSKFTGTIMLAK